MVCPTYTPRTAVSALGASGVAHTLPVNVLFTPTEFAYDRCLGRKNRVVRTADCHRFPSLVRWGRGITLDNMVIDSMALGREGNLSLILTSIRGAVWV